MTVAYLLKHDKFGSNFVLIKQNLLNSIILPPKNGGFKARSHSVRKANSTGLCIYFNKTRVLMTDVIPHSREPVNKQTL